MRRILILAILITAAAAIAANSQEQTAASDLEAPQMIDLNNGKAALCVNCPKVIDIGGKKQIICKDRGQTCDLYLGFVATPKSKEYTEDGKEFTYRIADPEEFSTTENNFVVKSATIGYLMETNMDAPLYFAMPDGRENLLKEIGGKVVTTADGRNYKLDSLILADYALVQNGIITMNSQGELTEITGTAKKAAKQKLASMIDEKARIEIPLKSTEKLTFRGLDAKDGYAFLEPVLEAYNPNEKDKSFEKWLALIDEEYKYGTDGKGASIQKLCGTDFFYHAPGSKFQVMSTTGEKECDIKRYVLTTDAAKGGKDRWQYVCGDIVYDAEPGKLTNLYCDSKNSGIDCRGDKKCQQSQFNLKIDRSNKIELGTNSLIPDSRFEYAKKAEKPNLFELKAEEIKVGRDYILPADSQAAVMPMEEDMEDLARFSVIEAGTGTNIIREWASKELVHKLMTSTDGKNVKYKIGIYEDSNELPIRLAAVYPSEFFNQGAKIKEEEHEEVRSANTPETGRANLPTVGIKLEQFQSIGKLAGGEQFAFDIKYYALSKQELEKRGPGKTATTYKPDTIAVKKNENLYNVLSSYCAGLSQFPGALTEPDVSEGDTQLRARIEAVEKIAKKIIEDVKTNPDSQNAGYLTGEHDYKVIAKDGELALPEGPMTFTHKDPKKGKFAVNVIPARCGMMTGPEKGYTVERKLGEAAGLEEAARKGQHQRCTSSATRTCYKVAEGSSIRKVYSNVKRFTKCKGEAMPYEEFRRWIFDNNPIVSKRPDSNWKDRIWAGDDISVPQICEGMDCPQNDFDCDDGAKRQGAFLTGKDKCGAYAKETSSCPLKCGWDEAAGCVLAPAKAELPDSAKKLLEDKKKAGRIISYIENIISHRISSRFY